MTTQRTTQAAADKLAARFQRAVETSNTRQLGTSTQLNAEALAERTFALAASKGVKLTWQGSSRKGDARCVATLS